MCACVYYAEGGEEEKKKGERDGKHLFPISSFVPTVAAAGANERTGRAEKKSSPEIGFSVLFHFWGYKRQFRRKQARPAL